MKLERGAVSLSGWLPDLHASSTHLKRLAFSMRALLGGLTLACVVKELGFIFVDLIYLVVDIL